MASSRAPARVRMLRGWYSTLRENLRQRVATAAKEDGLHQPAEETTAFIRIAKATAPGLLDRIDHVRCLLRSER